MKKKFKKLLFKKITIPNPENFLNKKFSILIFIIIALFFDLLILSSAKSFLNFDFQGETINLKEIRIKSLVNGYPIEEMVPYITRKDKQTAAFLIGIAKKESNWGKHSPKLNGKNCYNYWGYRGQGESITPSGYTCFKNPQEAVDIVGKRISNLINKSGLNTPSKMIVWKCGWSCNQHSNYSIKKWISDVTYYYEKIYL